jgi:aspartate aminotransferase
MLAERMSHFSGSPTSALIAKVAELRAQGQNIISLNVGEPDFGTPDNIKCGAIKAIVDNFTKYTAGNGIIELRKLIAKKLKEDNNLEYTTDEICATVGAKQAIFNSVMAIAGPGDEVILPIPCWVSYTEMIKFAGAKPVFVPVSEENGYDLDVDAIAKAITPNTRGIIICTPNNPSGAVYSEETLRKLAALAVEHDFYIIADEIYEKLIYDGEKHFSIGSISKEVWEHTITVNGFSKAYAMTGWRLGYVASTKEVIDGIKKIQSQTTSATSAISQKAGVAALSGPQHDLEVMVAEFDKRRKYMLQRLAEMPGVSCTTPKGAFYLLPDFSCYFGKKYQGKEIKNAIDFANTLLAAELVALVPGEAFNIPGKVRMSYSNSLENLGAAMDRIQKFVSELQD